MKVSVTYLYAKRKCPVTYSITSIKSMKTNCNKWNWQLTRKYRTTGIKSSHPTRQSNLTMMAMSCYMHLSSFCVAVQISNSWFQQHHQHINRMVDIAAFPDTTYSVVLNRRTFVLKLWLSELLFAELLLQALIGCRCHQSQYGRVSWCLVGAVTLWR